MPLFKAQIKPFGCAVPMSGHLALELGVISGFSGGDYTAFGLIGKGSDSPVQPLCLRI
jgi:hypothetical protein